MKKLLNIFLVASISFSINLSAFYAENEGYACNEVQNGTESTESTTKQISPTVKKINTKDNTLKYTAGVGAVGLVTLVGLIIKSRLQSKNTVPNPQNINNGNTSNNNAPFSIKVFRNECCNIYNYDGLNHTPTTFIRHIFPNNQLDGYEIIYNGQYLTNHPDRDNQINAGKPCCFVLAETTEKVANIKIKDLGGKELNIIATVRCNTSFEEFYQTCVAVLPADYEHNGFRIIFAGEQITVQKFARFKNSLSPNNDGLTVTVIKKLTPKAGEHH